MLRKIINEDWDRWAKSANKKYGHGRKFWMDLISGQKGRCALTDAPLFFDSTSGTPQAGGPGSHPLYASVDHVHPGRGGKVQILCYDINDLKGHLPAILFDALKKTIEWKVFVAAWKEIAEQFPQDIQKFKDLIKEGAPK